MACHIKGGIYIYSNPKTGDSLVFLSGMGLFSIASKTIILIIICGVIITLFSLLSKRFAIEPIHEVSGEYRWAITKNGHPILWLRRKSKHKNKMKA